MKKFHYIYKVIHIDSKKEYIGIHSTNNLNDGYFANGVYYKNNKWIKLNHGEYNGYQHIKNAMIKYGRDAFNREIIEYCKNRDELLLRERELVDENFISSFGGKTTRYLAESASYPLVNIILISLLCLFAYILLTAFELHPIVSGLLIFLEGIFYYSIAMGAFKWAYPSKWGFLINPS